MPIKLLNVGETGTGKTGALAALCAAGYNVRLLDLENGAETLINILNDPASKYPKDSISRLRWRTLTEPMRVMGGMIVPRGATVYPGCVGMLEKWTGDMRYDPKAAAEQAKGREPTENELRGYAKCEDSLGTIYNWSSKDVLALDTLSSLGEGATNHVQLMQGKLGDAKMTSMESMRFTGSAQGLVEKFLQFMRDDNLKCNVVINTHLNWAKEDGSNISMEDAANNVARFGFPSAVGKALNQKIGRNFNHMLMTRKLGHEHRIYTRGVPNIGLKSGAPLRVKESYALHMGLAEYFADVNKVGGQV